jgi:hypothetical protein
MNNVKRLLLLVAKRRPYTNNILADCVHCYFLGPREECQVFQFTCFDNLTKRLRFQYAFIQSEIVFNAKNCDINYFFLDIGQ